MSSPPWDYIAKLVCIGDSGCGKSSLTIRLCEGRFVQHHDVTIGVEFGSRIVPVGPPYSNSSVTPSRGLSSPPGAAAEGTTTTAAATAATATTRTPTRTASAGNRNNSRSAEAAGLPPPPVVPIEKPTATPAQKHMKLSLWDTAGQETYKSVTRSYFRGASGALLVFDLTRKSTFQHATDWLNDLRQIAEPDIVVVLVGNKADLVSPDPPPSSSSSPSPSFFFPLPRPTTAICRGRGGGEWARRNGVLEYVETSAKSGENVEMAFMRVAERIFQNIQAGKYDLNDRRSGVKVPNPAAAAASAATGTKAVRLTNHAGRGALSGGGCC
ncbi:hypothetical protein VTH06DRAFT_1415 [Thermothelomyces fergusii]